MTITEIALRMNEQSRGRAFGELQQVRRRNGNRTQSNSPFAGRSIKAKENYAFHSGGRKELQFNIGEEEGWEQGPIFRYGLAMSLHQDNTLHNPESEFLPLAKRFNDLLQEQPVLFDGYHMWYYNAHRFVDFFEQVQPVIRPIFNAHHFIFIGKFFLKGIAEISEADIATMLDAFDDLMEIYQRVQFPVPGMEKRLARICWNDKNWCSSSGRDGKSTDKETHEGRFGYGHEEWLLDLNKTVNDYHYGFLEGVRKKQSAYNGRLFEVWLYSHFQGKRWWVGKIEQLEVINPQHATEIKEQYRENGWLEQMENQIKQCGANNEGFSNYQGVDLFNVRFLPSAVRINEMPILIPEDSGINRLKRYDFAFFANDFFFEQPAPNNITGTVASPASIAPPNPITYLREQKLVELTQLHREISQRLTDMLVIKYGRENVFPENPTGYGTRVDIVVKEGPRQVFYEIKTYPNSRISVREAIGQLIEYAHWTQQQKAQELIIVTHIPADEQLKKYFEHLRNRINPLLFYQSLDLQNGELSVKH
jgi:hypothetical protein